MNTLLRCDQLTKKYGSKTALNGVNLDLKSGRIIGLLGPNGSGKTTLIKLINGLLVPTDGHIEIDGHEPGVYTKSIVSYLPDKLYFNDWMKVKDILEYFDDFYEDFDMDRANNMLEMLHISPGDTIKHLSKGNCEKVQLILTMSRRAKLYCLDEPIAGVDPAGRDYILKTILSNYDENATILISTHLISDIENILDDFIFLQDGNIRMYDSVDAVRQRENTSVDHLFREVFKC